jgi:hypothetical protein
MYNLAILIRASNERVWKVVKARFLDGKWTASGETRNDSTR